MIIGFSDEYDIGQKFNIGSDAWDWIVYAIYDREQYDGSAMVVFEKDGALYEVHGSHCSCFGLEDQWDPEATTEEELRFRKYGHQESMCQALDEWKKNKIIRTMAGIK